MEKLLGAFIDLPLWGKFLVAFVVLCLIDGVWLAWGERKFVAGVAEATLAVALYWGSIIASLGLGYFLGKKTKEKSNCNTLGWVVGILVFLVIGTISGLVISEIPGVGWRYDLMMSGD